MTIAKRKESLVSRETITDNADKPAREKYSGFPCPHCQSLETHILRIPMTKNWPLIFGAMMMPNYQRKRECRSCGLTWRTCESVVLGSGVKDGENIL